MDSKNKAFDNAMKELRRYLSQAEEIRRLSAPQARYISGAEAYRKTLVDNYKAIGDLARDNIEILNRQLYTRLNFDGKLSREDVEVLRSFSGALNDAYQNSNLDSSLVYEQALRLLEEADKSNDEDETIAALDELVSASYYMLAMTSRLLPVSETCMEYYNTGMKASERLLAYLDKDRFRCLSDESKRLVLINARYIRVVSEIDGVAGTTEQNALMLKRMKTALALSEDPFYREQLPDYDWELHEFRTLEYICSLTDYNNEKQYGHEDLLFINECTKRILELYNSSVDKFKEAHHTKDIELYLARNAYLVGEISREEYKETLKDLTNRDFRQSSDEEPPLVMLHAPYEYLLLVDKNNITEEDRRFLSHFYVMLISYMNHTPKMGEITFLVSYLSLIMRHYIELPGDMSSETMGLNLLAALSPTTYVHTLCVADFTTCLTDYLLQKEPERFVGMPGYNSVSDVLSGKEDIINFAYHAALCHDFGKLLIIETIFTHCRKLSDKEFELIKVHPAIGAYYLSLSDEADKYTDIAIGHHKWFNNAGGYPADFDMNASPYKTIISIVTCADCLDAATDSVGRSYKHGKDLNELIEEFRAESGTRYAPYVVDLFDDDALVEEIKDILENRRDKNYRETYSVLNNYN